MSGGKKNPKLDAARIFPVFSSERTDDTCCLGVMAWRAFRRALNALKIHRKDLLLRLLRKMKAVHGDVYDFHPDSYLLPTEYTKFINAFTRLQESVRVVSYGLSLS